ncbi:MAG TPA: right-handed parallel beta-helix repeat-containing protein [Paludibacteraceae bacterium]|nr:right-handed parallel beta-helix repeat-containing protein [Paludibacteraceae bacterium]
MKKFTILLLITLCSISAFSTRYLVQPGSAGAATWRTAGAGETLVDLTAEGKTLNAWLTATFTSFPEGDQIWLIKGIYQVNAIFNIPANFTIYGGFAGNETTIDERIKGSNPWDFSNETTLDGNNATAIWGCASNRTALIDGITFTKGYISGNSAGLTTRLGVVVRNSKFLENNATGQGGAILMNAGGEVYDSYFYNNSANLGGAVHIGGVGASVVSGCLFENNKAITGANKQGGAIRSQSTVATIINSKFINNDAAGNGSAIYTQVDTDKANKIINCVFYGNKTKSALYLRGAAVYNSTIVNNEGGGVYTATKDAQIYNSVFWAKNKSKATVSGVDVAGVEYKNNASITIPTFPNWTVADNIQLDTLISETNYPYFADPLNNDWTITYKSPLLNAASNSIAGVPTTDFLGLARPQGSAYDIGAYELPYCNITVTFNTGGTVNSYTSGDIIAQPKGIAMNYTITPNSGYKISAVSYNGTDVTSQLSENVYTAPALTGISTLNVTFETDPGTHLSNLKSTFKCFTSSNQITIEGINIGEKVIVFNALGAKVKEVNANASNISLHVSKGIYIVRAADQATKVIVK